MKIELEKSKIRALMCAIAGHHIGNVVWGEEGPNRTTIHKCSFCYRPKQKKKNEKTKSVC